MSERVSDDGLARIEDGLTFVSPDLGRAMATELLAARATLAAQAEEVGRMKAGLETAWCLIANAHSGDWTKGSPEWHKAAERWRDEYHAGFAATRAPAAAGAAAQPPAGETESKAGEAWRCSCGASGTTLGERHDCPLNDTDECLAAGDETLAREFASATAAKWRWLRKGGDWHRPLENVAYKAAKFALARRANRRAPSPPPADAARAVSAEERAAMLVFAWKRDLRLVGDNTVSVDIAAAIRAAEDAAEARTMQQMQGTCLILDHVREAEEAATEAEYQRIRHRLHSASDRATAAEAECARLRAALTKTQAMLTRAQDIAIGRVSIEAVQPARGDTRGLALAFDRALIAGGADHWARAQEFAAVLAAWLDARKP